METNNKQDKVEKTINVLDNIDEVKVSPFFKNTVMQKLLIEKEQKQSVWSWFTPQLQLATLVCVIILNVFALTQLETDATSSTELDEFAQTYNLSVSEEDTSIFN